MTELVDLLDSLLVAVTVGGAREEAGRVAGELADRAAEDFPTLHTALDLLDYHGELALINDIMARAWPQVQTSAAYSRRAVSAYAGRAGDHLIYTYLESASTSADDFSQLQGDIERYFDVDAGRLQTYLSFLAGEAGRRWGTDDFDELNAAPLSALLVEFVGMARRAGISFGKAHLVREHLPRYFLDRRAGYLYPREDVAALLRHGRRPPTAVSGEPGHPLLPDRLTLRNFLAKMVQTVEPQRYPAAAIVQLVPIWLRFLEVRRLVPGEEVAARQADLAGLSADLAAAWRESGDPVLLNALLPANTGSSRRRPSSNSSP